MGFRLWLVEVTVVHLGRHVFSRQIRYLEETSLVRGEEVLVLLREVNINWGQLGPPAQTPSAYWLPRRLLQELVLDRPQHAVGRVGDRPVDVAVDDSLETDGEDLDFERR
jgi:hypothetical protein